MNPLPTNIFISGHNCVTLGRVICAATIINLVACGCNQKPVVVSSESPTSHQPTTSGSDAIAYTTESLTAIKSRVEDGTAVLLDVRSQAEWDASHLRISKFIPIDVISDDSQRKAAVADFDPATPIYVHCQRGGRAMTAAKILAQQGFSVQPIQTEYERFAEAGFETISAGK